MCDLTARDCAALDGPLVVERFGQPHFSVCRSSAERLKVPAALRVRFLRAACAAYMLGWLLRVSRLIASRMVFRAQGESPRPDLGKNEPRPRGASRATKATA